MYVNMDDDLLVRFHPFLVLLVPSFSHPIGGSVLSIPSQNKKDTIDPCNGVDRDFSSFSFLQGLLLLQHWE
jgi:hypothetical protein